MLLKLLKGKIHRATVTAIKVDYPGSVAVDSELLDAAGIMPYESVLMANVSSGARAETYVIPAPAGSGTVKVLGAAALKFNPGDIVIFLNFAFYTAEEAAQHKPKVVLVDDKNAIERIL
jgi:aspartate 1-decarboxylase